MVKYGENNEIQKERDWLGIDPINRSSDIKILARESDWHDRGTREGIYIRAIQPSLNRNEGRHELPHCYDTLIRNAIKKPDPPATHTPNEPRLQTERRAPGRPRTQPPGSDNQSQTSAKEFSSPTVVASTHTMATRSRTAHSNEDRGLTWLGQSPISLSPSLSSFCPLYPLYLSISPFPLPPPQFRCHFFSFAHVSISLPLAWRSLVVYRRKFAFNFPGFFSSRCTTSLAHQYALKHFDLMYALIIGWGKKGD